MWSNRRSFLLLVHIKKEKRFGFVFPLALPVLEATLDSLRDSLEVWESLFPGFCAKFLSKRSKNSGKQMRLSLLLTQCIALLNELRQHGAFEIVQVDDGKSHVSIGLW